MESCDAARLSFDRFEAPAALVIETFVKEVAATSPIDPSDNRIQSTLFDALFSGEAIIIG
jgi:hypothetical protein